MDRVVNFVEELQLSEVTDVETEILRFGSMTSNRTRKVGDRIREEISELLLRRVKDPRIGFVTITGVELSPNLRYAKVYYSVVGTEEDRKRAGQGLESACGFIKRELAGRLQLKFMPDIEFHYDSFPGIRGTRWSGCSRSCEERE